MRQAGTLSILLAAALLLLPWQICACDEDGPELKVLWDHRECPHDHGPAGESEDDHDCDAAFTFEALATASTADLAPPLERRVDLGVPGSGSALGVARLHEEGPRIRPPDEGPREATRHLATRLLL